MRNLDQLKRDKDMKEFYARPYDMDAKGFYFEDGAEFSALAKQARNGFNQPVEEFELSYVGDDALDAALFEALSVHQGSIHAYCNHVAEWDQHTKLTLIIAVGECGYSFSIGVNNPTDLEVDLYANVNLRDLAEQFIDEGLFGDIPERISHYIDYDIVARDLSADYTETNIAGQAYVYRCA